MFAIAGGAAVGSLYWAQPLLGFMVDNLLASTSTAGWLVTVIQIGYPVGIVSRWRRPPRWCGRHWHRAFSEWDGTVRMESRRISACHASLVSQREAAAINLRGSGPIARR